MKLFCFPYSGGSANIYSKWKTRFTGIADVIAIEYRGHGSLFNKGLYTSINELCDDITERYFKDNYEPFILYGHSLGSLVAYELTCELKKRNYPMPMHIVVASLRPPHLLERRKKYTTMSNNDFWERVIQLGNTPREVLENKELKEIAYEILYSDMKLVDDYVCNEINILDIPLTVWFGLNDYESPEDEMKEWNKYTKKDFVIKLINGDHFFAFKESGHELLINYLKNLIQRYV